MKISVVTITYNNAVGLDKTLASVIALDIPYGVELECIIVDGKSRDNTSEVVEKFRNRLTERSSNSIIIQFKSEPDNGIYDAMNKGIDRATGDWVIFMNAGDCFFSPDVIVKIYDYLSLKYDVIYGDVVCDYNGRYQIACAPDDVRRHMRISMPLYHQACFYSCDTIKKEKYSMDFRIAGDYEQIVRLICLSKKFYHVSLVISLFEYGGVSSYDSGKARLEDINIWRKYELISQNEYRKKIVARKAQNLLLSLIPKRMFRKRRERQFDNATKNWSREINEAIPEWYSSLEGGRKV